LFVFKPAANEKQAFSKLDTIADFLMTATVKPTWLFWVMYSPYLHLVELGKVKDHCPIDTFFHVYSDSTSTFISKYQNPCSPNLHVIVITRKFTVTFIMAESVVISAKNEQTVQNDKARCLCCGLHTLRRVKPPATYSNNYHLDRKHASIMNATI